MIKQNNLMMSLGWVGLTLAFVYVPTIQQIYFQQDSNLGGNTSALLLCAAIGLFLYRMSTVPVMPSRISQLTAWLSLSLGLLLFFFGSLLSMPMLTVGSIIPVLAAVVLLYLGPAAFYQAAFPLLLLLFVIPLPYMLTDFIVHPLKLFISHVTELILYLLGYPVARNGVVLILGDYQLLIADACSGINSLFSLEAIGLLYLHVMRKDSVIRNWIIGLCIIPISITSNITRVLILALLTYHFGNDVGQSFLHDLSGLLLFAVALLVIIALDGLLDRLLPVLFPRGSTVNVPRLGEGVQ